uniref:Uncharacterized protein n=1 Tax=Amphora coffeiformis TaxID=265554 RepID=A0A7S3LEL2_9STRA|mmetsp:Transcript_17596/g.33393  ORF Transcript_17596/g.33393 Transcript_17596/m.33393 type:complete len:227 (+) Transcript_17596:156-836(+)|eukprot:scaffold46158_cov191-Amphora_coffeaeformis.AAC.1
MTIYCSPATKARLISADSFTRRTRGSDDEVSITSTFTIDLTGKQNLCPTDQRRRVTFDESRNVYHNTPADEACIQERWESSYDMRQMKTKTVFLAKEISRSDRCNVKQNTFSYPRVVMGVYLTCSTVLHETHESPLTVAQRKQFYKWIDAAESRIGIERVCIQEMRVDKYRRRAQVVDAVMDAQYRPGVLCESRDELIRKAAQSISRASRLFARELALALASSLQN